MQAYCEHGLIKKYVKQKYKSKNNNIIVQRQSHIRFIIDESKNVEITESQ